MFGTVINNRQLAGLRNGGLITISDYKKGKMKTIHYPLVASKYMKVLRRRGSEPQFEAKAEFLGSTEDVSFDKNEYLIAEIKSRISVCPGIIGVFVPSSRLIDYGFSLTCGRLEHPYGSNGEVIRFGIKNQIDEVNSINKDLVLAYISFYDLRALAAEESDISSEDLDIIRRWSRKLAYAQDSGVHPTD